MFERMARIEVLAVIGCFSLAGAATAAEFGDDVGRAQNVTTSDMTVDDPLPPADLYRALDGESLDVRHHDLATFAWLEFIALNAPADPTMRGQPDGSFADSGFDPEATLVWGEEDGGSAKPIVERHVQTEVRVIIRTSSPTEEGSK